MDVCDHLSVEEKRRFYVFWHILDFPSSFNSQPNLYIILVFVFEVFESMILSHHLALPLTHSYFIFASSFPFCFFASPVTLHFLLVFVSFFFPLFSVTYSVAAEKYNKRGRREILNKAVYMCGERERNWKNNETFLRIKKLVCISYQLGLRYI